MKRIAGLIAFLVLFSAHPTRAGSIPIGDLEFDNLSLGVNDFTVNNFTGSNNLSFFPVADNLTFDNVVLTATESDGTILTFSLGNISPGTNTNAQFADTLLFTQVVFSATLSPNIFALTNGYSGTFTAIPAISLTLLPSSGSYLVAGVDLGTINAVSTPEPSELLFLAVSLFGIAVFHTTRYLRKKCA
jgi:hypothetical protein